MIDIKFIYILILALFVGGISGYIGSLMVSKKMSLMGGALGHLTMPGIALAIVYGFDVSIGALIFLFIGIIVIWFLEQLTRLPAEALTAVVFASFLSISFLFLPEEKFAQALIGDISQVSLKMVLFTIVLSVIIFFMIKNIYSRLVLISISSDIANSMHINVKKYNFIYLGVIAIIVALGVRVVGGLMTAALVSIPACTSRNITKNLLQYSYGSLILGGLAAFLGTLVFLLSGISAGPLIIIFSSGFFLLSLIIKK